MPLHLLGKKSWNVYNADNIARVRRDEAEAKVREEEEERRMQEIDAERRIKILRGEQPSSPPLPPSSLHDEKRARGASTHDRPLDDSTRYKKRRRLAGEDDTDRDIRFAKEDAARLGSVQLAPSTQAKRRVEDDLPIVDSKGHTNLFTAEMTRNNRGEKNAEAEADRAKKLREYEDQYTMRFSNASGFKEPVGKRPWYSSSAQDASAPDNMPTKDVWGNEDLRRAEREKARIDANDPLMAMKAGIRTLKKVERDRKTWKDEHARQLDELKQPQHDRDRHKHRGRSPDLSRDSPDSLEGFQLDPTQVHSRSRQRDGHREGHRHHRHRHRHRHRHHENRRAQS